MMHPSDISTVSDFIDDEIDTREVSGSAVYIRRAKKARRAFERILDEISRLQSSVPCSASSVNGMSETGEKDG